MKFFKLIVTLVTTFLSVFAISFLIDIPFFSENWIRYALIVILAILIFLLGMVTAKHYIDEL